MPSITDLEHRVQLAQEAAEAATLRGDFIAASRHQWRADQAVKKLTAQRVKEGES